MELYLPTEGDAIAAASQLIEDLKIFAATSAAYMAALLGEGFERDEALALVANWQNHHYARAA